jgi:hypothetical protein
LGEKRDERRELVIAKEAMKGWSEKGERKEKEEEYEFATRSNQGPRTISAKESLVKGRAQLEPSWVLLKPLWVGVNEDEAMYFSSSTESEEEVDEFYDEKSSLKNLQQSRTSKLPNSICLSLICLFAHFGLSLTTSSSLSLLSSNTGFG